MFKWPLASWTGEVVEYESEDLPEGGHSIHAAVIHAGVRLLTALGSSTILEAHLPPWFSELGVGRIVVCYVMGE